MKAFFRKLLAALAATSAVLLLLGAAIFFWYRSASAPQIDGRLVLMRPAAVSAAVASGAHAAPARSGGGSTDIVRDANAVAHIYAGSTDEARPRALPSTGSCRTRRGTSPSRPPTARS